MVRWLPREWCSDARHYQIAALSTLLVFNLGWLDFGARPLNSALAIAGALATQALCTRLCKLPSFDPRSALITGLSAQCAAARGHGADPRLEPRHALLRWTGAEIPVAVFREVMRAEAVAEEIEALLARIAQRGLRFVQLDAGNTALGVTSPGHLECIIKHLGRISANVVRQLLSLFCARACRRALSAYHPASS
jgi:hypothetical protein